MNVHISNNNNNAILSVGRILLKSATPKPGITIQF